MSGSDPFGHGSRVPDRGDDGIGTPLSASSCAIAADCSPPPASGAALDPDGAKTWGEIVDFAAAELGAERAEELRERGSELSLDAFAALSR